MDFGWIRRIGGFIEWEAFLLDEEMNILFGELGILFLKKIRTGPNQRL